MTDIEKFIPYGLYCYETLSIEPSEKYGFIMHVKPCDHFLHIHGIEGHCKLLKCDVWDEVKECGMNDYVGKRYRTRGIEA